jgi:hypothetical protein
LRFDVNHSIKARSAIALLVSFSSLGLACFAKDDASSTQPDGGGGVPDSGALADGAIDATTPVPDGGNDGGSDAGGDASTGDGSMAPTYGNVHDVSRWSQLALASVGVTQTSFTTAAFDGRYVYFAPGFDGFSNPQSQIARYDTQAAWTSASAWTTFDLAAVSANAKELGGAAFDGRYLYFAPQGQNSAGSAIVRYDTQASFTTATSWSVFDSTTLPNAPVGFRGAAFDGRWVYLSGGQARVTLNPYVVRYDTQAAFGQIASWEEYATAYVVPYAEYNDGVVSDGRYAYFNVTYANSAYSADIVRFDSQLGFANANAWTKFDLTTVVPGNTDYAPGVFDGRYVYYANRSGKIVRLDPQLAFTTAAAWTVFDVTGVDADAKGFARAAFDGRYVSFAQIYTQPNGKAPMARFDTQGSFTSAASWTTIDLAQFATPQAFSGAGGFAFDGRYMYIAPNIDDETSALRFDVRTPPALPPSYKGSFF